jgi:hypothetical protein
MFRTPTVVILGAGANCELGLPLGKDLMTRVEASLRFGERITDNARELRDLMRRTYGAEWEAYKEAARKLVQAMSMFPSMDEALHYFSADEKCLKVGKAAIVNSIIGAEAECRLNFEGRLGRPDLAKTHDTWLPEFLSMAASGVTKEEMPHIFRNIIFINFTYDRVLEHYFFWALQQYALLSPEQVTDIINRMQVIRPYGTVGIHWGGDGGGLKFGRQGGLDESLFQAAGEIRTFTEQGAVGIQEQIERAIENGRLFLVLGFGFHLQNLRLFDTPNERSWEPRRVFATAFNIEKENHGLLANGIESRFRARAPVTLLPKTARQMLVDLRPSIMVAAMSV